MEQTGKRCGENRCAKSQKPRRYPVEASRCRPQRVQHAKDVDLRDVEQIVGCCLFQPGCAVVGIGRDGCVVVIKYLRRQPVDLVAILFRPPFSDLTYFCPGVLGALAGVDFAQPLRAAARDDGANTGLPVNSSHGHLVTRSCRHTVNSSPVHSSQTRLITQSTRHKRAHGFDTVYICNSAYGLSLYPLLTHWSVTLTPRKKIIKLL